MLSANTPYLYSYRLSSEDKGIMAAFLKEFGLRKVLWNIICVLVGNFAVLMIERKLGKQLIYFHRGVTDLKDDGNATIFGEIIERLDKCY
jgi:hypothetical protein